MIIVQDRLTPDKVAITIQIIIDKINSIVSDMIEPITKISLGNIVSEVSFFIEYKTSIDLLVLLEKCVYWITPIRR
jgi:hypothetical protein